jgi:hypothetical protein
MKRGLLLLFVMTILEGVAWAVPWETLPPDHWAYAEIRWLQVEGYLKSLNPATGVYRRGEIAQALQADPKPESGMAQRRYKLLEAEFASEISTGAQWQFAAGGRLIAGFESTHGIRSREAGYGVVVYSVGNDRLGIYGAVRGDRDLGENPAYSGKRWRDFTGFTEAAYLTYVARRWEIKLGRDHLAWGPGDDHLILSDAPRGLDAISFKLRWGWGQFEGLLGQASDYTDSTGLRSNRFFSGHRLELAPVPWMRLGFSETLLFSSLRFGSLNPFLPYYGELVNEGSEGNGMLGLDFSIFPTPGLQVYGELLLDDIQIEEKDPKDLEPTEWGWLVGLRWAGLNGSLGAGISYEGITNRTYIAIEPQYQYTNYGLPLGSDLGNDADRLNVNVSCWPDARLRLDALFGYQSQGEGGTDVPFDTTYMNYTVEQGYDEPFPTGIIERTTSAGIGIAAFAHPLLQARGVIEHEWISNVGNVADIKDEGWRGRLEIILRLERIVRIQSKM